MNLLMCAVILAVLAVPSTSFEETLGLGDSYEGTRDMVWGGYVPGGIQVKSPRNGAAIELGGEEGSTKLVITLGGARGKPVRIDIDGTEWATLPSDSPQGVDFVVGGGGMWPIGIHQIEIFWVPDEKNDPKGVLVSALQVLVYDGRSGRLPVMMNDTPEMQCPLSLLDDSVAGAAQGGSTDVGLGLGKWKEYRECLEAFMELHPHCAAGLHELGKLSEAHGEWDEAIELYSRAFKLGWPRMDERLAELIKLAYEKKQRPECSWRASEESRSKGWGLGSEEADHSHIGFVGQDERCKAGTGQCWPESVAKRAELYLSVILVGRHDNTLFCQASAHGAHPSRVISLCTV